MLPFVWSVRGGAIRFTPSTSCISQQSVLCHRHAAEKVRQDQDYQRSDNSYRSREQNHADTTSKLSSIIRSFCAVNWGRKFACLGVLSLTCLKTPFLTRVVACAICLMDVRMEWRLGIFSVAAGSLNNRPAIRCFHRWINSVGKQKWNLSLLSPTDQVQLVLVRAVTLSNSFSFNQVSRHPIFAYS